MTVKFFNKKIWLLLLLFGTMLLFGGFYKTKSTRVRLNKYAVNMEKMNGEVPVKITNVNGGINDFNGMLYVLGSWGNVYQIKSGNGTKAIEVYLTDSIQGRKIVDISSGLHHTVALDDAGRVYAWGNNKYGQLGGDEPSVKEAQVLEGIPKAYKVFTGGYITAVLTKDNTLHIWGKLTCDQEERLVPNEPVVLKMNSEIVKVADANGKVFLLDKNNYLWSYSEGKLSKICGYIEDIYATGGGAIFKTLNDDVYVYQEDNLEEGYPQIELWDNLTVASVSIPGNALSIAANRGIAVACNDLNQYYLWGTYISEFLGVVSLSYKIYSEPVKIKLSDIDKVSVAGNSIVAIGEDKQIYFYIRKR